jgi:hypothetical protein
MADYSEAIEKGVYNWLEHNRRAVEEIISMAIIHSATSVVDNMAAGAMVAVGKFLDANADDLKAGIAVAIATSWASRQHPVPPDHTTKGDLRKGL